MTEPRTKAGKALAARNLRDEDGYVAFLDDTIAEIEAEASAVPDVERLAAAIHNSTARGTDHHGPTCRYCREDAEEYAAEYARLATEGEDR